MIKYVNFGDVISLKKEDFLDVVREANPNYVEGVAKDLSGIDNFKYTMNQNPLGMLEIHEQGFNSSDEELVLNNKHRNIISSSDIFSMLSKGKATLTQNEDFPFKDYNINRKIKVSDNLSLSDGDVFETSLKDFIDILKSSNMVHKDHIEKYNTLHEAGLEKVVLSFHYEDERNDSAFSVRKYKKEFRPNPYSYMVSDIYVGDEKLTFFKEPDRKTDLNSIKKSIDIDKYNFALSVEDIRNNDNVNYKNDDGLENRMKFHRSDCIRHARHESSIINFLFENHKQLKFVGNFRNDKNMFINIEEIIKISDTISNSPKNNIKPKKLKI